jgi:hypothetical protein
LHSTSTLGQVHPKDKLGVDILAGNLAWIQGLYPSSKYTNIVRFNKVLYHFLEPAGNPTANAGGNVNGVNNSGGKRETLGRVHLLIPS